MTRFIILLSLTLTALSASPAFAQKYIYVTSVFDGDTILLKGGTKVRLLAINTPEIDYSTGKAEPFAYQAKAELEKLIGNQPVRLELDVEKTDRYGRTLAHVYTKNGTWLNKALVEKGLAHVYSFPKNTQHVSTLLKAEEKARKKKAGIWSKNEWRIFDATDYKYLEPRVGKYTLVAGTITQASQVGDKIYLNFGKNYRQDFTIQILNKNKVNFSEKEIEKILKSSGKQVMVRGRILPINGPLINVTHPQQLTFM